MKKQGSEEMSVKANSRHRWKLPENQKQNKVNQLLNALSISKTFYSTKLFPKVWLLLCMKISELRLKDYNTKKHSLSVLNTWLLI